MVATSGRKVGALQGRNSGHGNQNAVSRSSNKKSRQKQGREQHTALRHHGKAPARTSGKENQATAATTAATVTANMKQKQTPHRAIPRQTLTSRSVPPPPPIDPWNPVILARDLAKAEEGETSPLWPVHDLRTDDAPFKLSKKKEKGQDGKELHKLAPKAQDKMIDLNDEVYKVPSKQFLGSGAYGSVFMLKDNSTGDAVAIKVEKAGKKNGAFLPWEQFVLSEIFRRNSLAKLRLEELSTLVISPIAFIKFRDVNALLLPYYRGATLDRAHQVYAKSTSSSHGNLPELLVMFYASKMLRSLELLHSVGILHCDIKPDNFLLTFAEFGGGQEDGLMMIDFGRSVIRDFHDSGTRFKAKGSLVSGYECPEQRTARGWTHEVDCYAVGALVKLLISPFGSSLPRPYKLLAHEAWKEFFADMGLAWPHNLGSSAPLPPPKDIAITPPGNASPHLRILRKHRQRFEVALDDHETRLSAYLRDMRRYIMSYQ